MGLVCGLCRVEAASPPNGSRMSSFDLPVPWMILAVVVGLSPRRGGTNVRGVM